MTNKKKEVEGVQTPAAKETGNESVDQIITEEKAIKEAEEKAAKEAEEKAAQEAEEKAAQEAEEKAAKEAEKKAAQEAEEKAAQEAEEKAAQEAEEKATQEAEEKAAQEAEEKAAKEAEEKATGLRKSMQPYFDSNPDVDKFHITSDEMPFYSIEDARRHQNSILPSSEIITVNR